MTVVESRVLGGFSHVLDGLASIDVAVICNPPMTLLDFCRCFQMWLNSQNYVLATGGCVLILHLFDVIENVLLCN